VHVGELGHAPAPPEHLTDVIKTETQVAQGTDQVKASDRRGVEAPVPPADRSAGGSTPLSHQNRIVRAGTPTRCATSPIV